MRRIERPLFGALVGLSLMACAEGIKPPEGNTAVRIEGGTFTMGAEDRDPCDLATPGLLECDPQVQSEIIPHPVQVASYCIDATEVTIEQYRHCVERGDCSKADITNAGRNNEESYIRRYYNEPDKYGDFPVVGISHDAAEAYCAFRGGRLPSEAEWEFAATSRGQRSARVYGEDPTLDNVISTESCDGKVGHIALGGCAKQFKAVGSSENDATAEFVMDMAGNVGEWVADEFDFLAYCENRDGYVVVAPGGGQPNSLKFNGPSGSIPIAVTSQYSAACETGCEDSYNSCVQICRASFGNTICAGGSPPPECDSDVQRRDFQRRSCRQTALDAGATAANVVGLDFTCDPANVAPELCSGDAAVCGAFCECVQADTDGFDITGNECINGCVDSYSTCFGDTCLNDPAKPVATTCEFATKAPAPFCVPRKDATGSDVRTGVAADLQFRKGQTSWVVRGGNVTDQLACLGRPTRRTVQSAPQALVGFRCAYDTGTPACN